MTAYYIIYDTDIPIHIYKWICQFRHAYLPYKSINKCVYPFDRWINMHLFLCIRMFVYMYIRRVGPITILTNRP